MSAVYFFTFIFFFTISPLIINFIISVIETYKYDKWQYTKIKDTSFEYNDLKDEIEKTALINSKYEYTIKNIEIYKKDSYGRTTNHYRKRFLTDLEKEYNRIIFAILDEHSNEFSESFKIYVLNRYHDATVSDLKNIIHQYLNSPEVKQLNNKKIMNKMGKYSLFTNFIELKSPHYFKKYLKEVHNISEITGIYLIYNETKDKYYVGQGKRAISRCLSRFTNPKDNAKKIKVDYEFGDAFFINFIKYIDTNYDTLDELEYDYIGICNSLEPFGYNKMRGNRTNK